MKTPPYTIKDNLAFCSKNLWKNNRPFYLWGLLKAFTCVAIPLLGILIQKSALDGILNQWEFSKFLYTVLFLTLATVLASLLNYCAAAGFAHHQNLNRMGLLLYIEKVFLKCPYQKAEDPKIQVELDKVSDLTTTSAPRTGVNGIHNGMYEVFVSLLGLLVFGGIAGSLHPLLLLLVLAGAIGGGLLERLADAKEFQIRMEEAPVQKKQEYFRNKLSKAQAGKDIRTYGCQGWLMKKLEGIIKDKEVLQKKQVHTVFQKEASLAGIELLQNGAAVCFITVSCVNGSLSISDFFVYLTAVIQLSQYMGKLIKAVNMIKYANMDVTEIRKFISIEQEEDYGEKIKAKAPEIRLDHVYFQYPGSKGYLLEDLNFTIKRGEKIALVGNNGAGKTTLVKLLCGFYQPTKGRILFDGEDIATFGKGELYEKISAVFQDIATLPFSVAENVALCERGEMDEEWVKACISQAGLKEKLPDIHAKMDKRVYPQGIELSGGEKQKLMFARALYKEAGILILDEPTAALDPVAESRLYQKYHEIASQKTTVFISHRLASTSFCDRILLLEKGKIVEEGTHKELLKKQGIYAKMFELQGRYYQKEAAENV